MKTLKDLLRDYEVEIPEISEDYLQTEVRYFENISHFRIQQYFESGKLVHDLEATKKMYNLIKMKGFNLHFKFK